MIHSFIHNFFFKKSIKTGLYIDYIFKKIGLSFVNKVFNWASLFILEKFLIEYLSRYILNFLTIYKKSLNKSVVFDYTNIIYLSIVLLFIIY